MIWRFWGPGCWTSWQSSVRPKTLLRCLAKRSRKRRDASSQSTYRAERNRGPRKPQIRNVQIRNLAVLDRNGPFWNKEKIRQKLAFRALRENFWLAPTIGCPKPQKLAEMKFWDFTHKSRDKTWSEKLGGVWGEILVGRSAQQMKHENIQKISSKMSLNSSPRLVGVSRGSASRGNRTWSWEEYGNLRVALRGCRETSEIRDPLRDPKTSQTLSELLPLFLLSLDPSPSWVEIWLTAWNPLFFDFLKFSGSVNVVLRRHFDSWALQFPVDSCHVPLDLQHGSARKKRILLQQFVAAISLRGMLGVTELAMSLHLVFALSFGPRVALACFSWGDVTAMKDLPGKRFSLLQFGLM